ncbi:alanine racemase C-terminal domain-containing protein [Gryllotalpicola reticulitermitis]|uniref:Alanine racemase C-terminal domain-containing protein n=1 Tax=Gryllotalpicola reticulitermitis TaxID=1184153 RepID=A0ABV8Q7Y7_9MICO
MSVPFREAEIDLDALKANVERFRELTEGAPLFVDVGADAWGHGLAVVVPALAEWGAQAFVVTRADEARTVRALAAEPLIVTTQHVPGDDFSWAEELGVAPTVRSREEFHRALAAGVQGVMLAEDTGEGFPGFAPDELEAIVAEAETRGVPAIVDSAFPVIGAELFGVSELGVDQADNFAPVLRFSAPIALTKRVGGGEGVSYGYTYRTAAETTLALITLGYGDGLSRAAGNRTEASVDGTKHPLAGRVAMDATMLDLGDVSAPALGTPAVIVGDAGRGEPTAQQHAEALGTHSAEITTRISKRVRRSASGGAQ